MRRALDLIPLLPCSTQRVDIFDDDGDAEASAVICRIERGIEQDTIYCDDEPDEPRPPTQLARVQAGAAALLRCAAAAGDERTIKGLIDRGVDAITSVEEGTKDSALHCAARAAQPACVKVLLKLGMKGYAENAQQQNSVQVARSLTIPPRLRHKLSRIFEPDSPHEVMEAMSAHIDALDDEPAHATFCRLIRDDDEPLQKIKDALKSMKKKKLQREAINPSRRRGRTYISPLHFAACYGRLDVVEFLVRNGADTEGTIDERLTALHLAAYEGEHCLLSQ